MGRPECGIALEPAAKDNLIPIISSTAIWLVKPDAVVHTVA